MYIIVNEYKKTQMTLNEIKCADANNLIKRFFNTFIWRNKSAVLSNT